jgi:hypothetical protein
MILPASRLPNLHGDVPLVPHTGIQFLDVPLPLEKARVRRDWFEQPRAEGLAALKPLAPTEDGEGFAFATASGIEFVAREDEGRYTLDAAGALLPFLGKWVPVPFLQVEVDGTPGRRKLAPGPQNWARMRIVKLSTPEAGGLSHRAVFAFDTHARMRQEDVGFLTPRSDESARFALGTRLEEVAWLLACDWFDNWLREIYRERDSRGIELRRDAEVGCRHFAAFLTMLAVLEESGAVPSVRLIDLEASRQLANGFIDVDLVLDLGNSRSCGFLVENTPGRDRELRDVYKLALRDLGQPEHVWDDPFESRMEFARPSFGSEEWSLHSGRGDAFDWPSPVRIGPEAVRLSAQNTGNQGHTGMSSPKRYLWDEKAQLTPWRFNPATSDEAEGIRGSYLRWLTEDGTVKSMRRGSSIALQAMFSRASMFTLFLLEVLLQARSQVNSYAVRHGRQDVTAPRRIASLVLTLPPAMPPEEARKVRERARAAAYLYRDITGEGRPGPRAAAEPDMQQRAAPVQPLSVEVTLDEATATQIVFLFDQISHVFRGDAPDYIASAGRPRQLDDGPPRPSLRVASIDVGGGTTDLAIYTYTLNDRVVVPRETFREGFRLAGDDVLETVVMRHVMPPLRRALAEAGMGRVRAQRFLVRMFQVTAATEPERQARRLVLNHILASAAMGILSAYEGWDAMMPGGVEVRPIAELLTQPAEGLVAEYPQTRGQPRAPARPRAARWFDEQVADAGLSGFSIEAVTVPVDLAAVDRTVREVLGEALEPLCEVIHRYNCDVLLLSGRGARWPAVADMLVSTLAVEPHRVQPMHRYRIGSWYPCGDGAGQIADPKTTVVVGAMLHRLLRDGQFDNLAMADTFAQRSTARYVGLMEDDRRILTDRILFRDLDLVGGADVETADEVAERPLTLSARSFLGFKQFAAERWPASALYRLELAADAAAGVALPVNFTLRRQLIRDENGEVVEFQIDEQSVSDAVGRHLRPGSVAMNLQTMPTKEGNHWLDSGQLQTLDSLLDSIADQS